MKPSFPIPNVCADLHKVTQMRHKQEFVFVLTQTQTHTQTKNASIAICNVKRYCKLGNVTAYRSSVSLMGSTSSQCDILRVAS